MVVREGWWSVRRGKSERKWRGKDGEVCGVEKVRESGEGRVVKCAERRWRGMGGEVWWDGGEGRMVKIEEMLEGGEEWGVGELLEVWDNDEYHLSMTIMMELRWVLNVSLIFLCKIWQDNQTLLWESLKHTRQSKFLNSTRKKHYLSVKTIPQYFLWRSSVPSPPLDPCWYSLGLIH